MSKPRLHLQNPKPTASTLFDSYDQTTDFKVTMYCINNTVYDVTMVHRDDLAVEYRKTYDQYNGPKNLIVRKNYQITSYQRMNDIINGLQMLLTAKGRLPNEDLKLIYNVLIEQRKLNKLSHVVTINIDRSVDVETIHKEGNLYIPETDTMFYIGTYNINMLHPYGSQAKAQQIFDEDTIQKGHISSISLQIVDNHDQIASRYISVAGRLLSVPVIKDVERANGLYVKTNDNGHVKIDSIALDQMSEQFGIYATAEEAMTAGNPDILHRSALKESEKELELIKIESAREIAESKQRMLKLQQEHDAMISQFKKDSEEQKRQSEQEKFDLERRLRKLELRRLEEKDLLEERSNKRKDHYERRSYERKDTSEAWKTAGVIVAGALSIFAVMKKS